MIEVSLLYTVAAVVIGYDGRNHTYGFLGWFFIAMLLTPIVGLILRLVLDK